MYCEIEHNHRSNEEQDGKIVASLAKWLSVRLRTKWLWVRIPLLSLKLQIWRLLRAWSSLTFRQTTECRFTLKLIRDMIITYSQTSIFVIIRRIYHYRFMCNHIKNERYFASFLHFWNLHYTLLSIFQKNKETGLIPHVFLTLTLYDMLT